MTGETIMKAVTFGIAALVATLALLGSGGEARADGYALVNVENPTNLTINYSFRWGDGSWQKVTLGPGMSMLHSWAYEPGSRSSPPFQISFDYTLNDHAVESKQYTLVRYAAHCTNRRLAKRYAFRKSSCGCYLDLYAVN
jgi:hypothetical protein